MTTSELNNSFLQHIKIVIIENWWYNCTWMVWRFKSSRYIARL